jgi:hypothetical protein
MSDKIVEKEGELYDESEKEGGDIRNISSSTTTTLNNKRLLATTSNTSPDTTMEGLELKKKSRLDIEIKDEIISNKTIREEDNYDDNDKEKQIDETMES